MIGNLDRVKIDQLLKTELIGRIGCQADNSVYIVPMSYVYDGQAVYGHTQEGKKIEAMRNNPNVCFEVDNYGNLGNWQSVIAWGKFEEIENEEEKDRALKLLLARTLPVVSSSTTHIGNDWPFPYNHVSDIDGIVFKIVLSNCTGKYETTNASPVLHG